MNSTNTNTVTISTNGSSSNYLFIVQNSDSSWTRDPIEEIHSKFDEIRANFFENIKK